MNKSIKKKSIKNTTFTFISLQSEDIINYKSVLNQYDNFDFVCSNIEDEMNTGKYDVVVSPANSFGDMGGGIDYYYRKYFGNELQVNVKNIIKDKYHGELIVGNAFMIRLPRKKNPLYFIVAPTMREPSNVSGTINAYLAFKAILECLEKTNKYPKNILIPCLAIGVGQMPAKRSAWQIKMAYDAFHGIKYENSDIVSIYDIYDYDGWVGIRYNNIFMKKIK